MGNKVPSGKVGPAPSSSTGGRSMKRKPSFRHESDPKELKEDDKKADEEPAADHGASSPQPEMPTTNEQIIDPGKLFGEDLVRTFTEENERNETYAIIPSVRDGSETAAHVAADEGETKMALEAALYADFAAYDSAQRTPLFLRSSPEPLPLLRAPPRLEV